MVVNVRDILNELSLEALKGASKLKNIKIESRKRTDYIEELSAYDWSDEEIKKLIDILKRDKENSIKALIVYVFKSSDLLNLTKDKVKSIISEHSVDFAKEEISGFKIGNEEDQIINCEYWYTQKKLILDDTGNLHNFKMPSQIKFEINLSDGLVTIYAINPGLALKCKKSIKEALGIKMHPISPLEVA